MHSRYCSLVLALLGLAGVFAVGGKAPTEEPDAPPGGVEVLARGPVHEGFADPADRRPQPAPVIAKQPADAIDELPPDQKPDGPDVRWIPGYWAWDEERSDFLWVSGFWRNPPPGRQWMPGHWQRVEAGWQWVPGFWGVPGQREIDLVPPPPPSVESGPSVPAPGEDYLYQPGCWTYREERYLWQPGCWYAPRADYLWIPSHYVWTPCGCVFVPGYWDYPLQDRGLLFAPVCIDRRVYLQPNYCFTPSHCIPCDGLFGALFVRPGCCCYFFGDYFGLRYERQGFCAWLDCRVGQHACDPLWNHYQHRHRWEGDLHGVYVGRRNGDIPPPPRTLAQQHTLHQHHHETGTVHVKNAALVAPLHQVDPQTVKLQTLPHEHRIQEQQAARPLREVARQRNQAEGELLAKAPPTHPAKAVQKVKVELPATAAPHKEKVITPGPPPPPAAVVHHEPAHAVHAANLLPPAGPVPHPSAPLKQDPVPPHGPKTEVPPAPIHAPAAPKHDTPPPPHQKDPAPPSPPPHKEPAAPPAPKKEPAPPPPSPPPPPPPPKVNVAPPPPKINIAPPPPPPVRAMPPPPQPHHAAPPPPAHHHHK
jgi:hypothetical protein